MSINFGEMPHIESMTLSEAKAYIIERAQVDSWDYDVDIKELSRVLLECLERRNQNQANLQGGYGMRVQTIGGSPYQQIAKHSRILYDAAWELVREGLLRPGVAHFGSLNERATGFCLTLHGRAVKSEHMQG